MLLLCILLQRLILRFNQILNLIWKVLSYNKLKSIFNECDLLSKNVEDYLQDYSWRNGDHSGTYTKVSGEYKCIMRMYGIDSETEEVMISGKDNCIMRGMTETVESGNIAFVEVCNNYNFFWCCRKNLWEGVIRVY